MGTTVVELLIQCLFVLRKGIIVRFIIFYPGRASNSFMQYLF